MLNYFFGLVGYVITMAASVRLISLLVPSNTNSVALPRSRGPILSLFGMEHFLIHMKLYLTVLQKPLPKFENFLFVHLFVYLWIYLFIYLVFAYSFTYFRTLYLVNFFFTSLVMYFSVYYLLICVPVQFCSHLFTAYPLNCPHIYVLVHLYVALFYYLLFSLLIYLSVYSFLCCCIFFIYVCTYLSMFTSGDRLSLPHSFAAQPLTPWSGMKLRADS
jgi:hypothetical protein